MKAGFVSFVGRPNAGKSTLLNRIVGQKLAIVSDKPQTTRTRVVGVKNYDGGQIVLSTTLITARFHFLTEIVRGSATG